MAASSVGSIKRHFRKLWDCRVRGRTRHLLVDIIVMAICAVIADCDSWREIALFAQKRLTWFRRFWKLPGGAPAHDTFERVFNQLDSKAFQATVAASNFTNLMSTEEGFLKKIGVERRFLAFSAHTFFAGM
jgi:hypothetical protein